MSSRRIPTTPVDVAAIIAPIVDSAMPAGARAGSKRRAGDDIFVLVRADLQNSATPISRYCRVGLTAFYKDSDGNQREDLAISLCATAGRALLDSRDTLIVAAEWQSGPIETVDAITGAPVAYATVLLEVLEAL